MPFQSEKQRRYLWANEPEIARDWADTYGSRIKKDDGGITRIGMKSGWSGPGAGRDKQGYQSSSPHSQASHDRGGQQHQKEAARYETKRQHTGGDQSNVEANKLNIQKMIKSGQGKHGPDHLTHNIPSEKFKRIPGKFPQFAKDHWALKHLQPFVQKGTDRNKKFFIDKVLGSKNPKYQNLDWTEIDTDDELQALYNDWMLGRQEGTTDAYGNPWGGGEPQGPDGYMGYPSYAAWLAAQGGGGGGGTTTTPPVEEESDFQASLTTGADTPGYYVGSDPTAANKAWGKAYGVDPRTMGMTSFAADGGRIPAAFGGIMDTDTGRRAYGFGSFFKKIGRAAKKVLKSPIAKIGIGALAMGMPWGGAGTAGIGKGWFGSSSGFGKIAPWLLKGGKGAFKSGAMEGWNPWKIGIGAATALPFLMGDKEEDESSNFDYEDAKTKYWNEIMGIKKGVAEGTLKNPHDWSYLPSDYIDNRAEGGRIGLYAGGQSVPSDYTMEDAMMTTTQDKLGGITDVMKQADLSRAGSVGQFYAAQGGRIGFAGGMNEKLAELKKAYNTYIEGGGTLSFEKFSAAFAEENFAQGGRIGAQEGGLMDLGGMEKDYRNDGGFVPLGGEEKADDVPARLSKNEFVFTADAVRGAGDGDIDKGAEIMENIMKNLEQGGQISEETQGLSGAQEMFGVSERLSEVV